eukprot:CAMPEP_0119270300 /NCGR_PEP_ID=MMETSP1329-20130426/7358_1 /TAXON_ID=114041 /ORGANISM="Genus nov. species nov., Strain RCC1024" /LENGTH=90 /DNA_ID=CAMNT_0007270317 /DNA_START=56 /DNA_END=328 /DNA_ORIENTATION=+
MEAPVPEPRALGAGEPIMDPKFNTLEGLPIMLKRSDVSVVYRARRSNEGEMQYLKYKEELHDQQFKAANKIAAEAYLKRTQGGSRSRRAG